MYYTVCYFTGIFDAVVRQISVLFMDSKDSVFKKGAHKQADMRAPAHSQPAIGWYLCTETYARFLYCTSFHRPPSSLSCPPPPSYTHNTSVPAPPPSLSHTLAHTHAHTVFCVLMFMYYTVCYFTGIFYAVERQISMLFIDNKDSVYIYI